MIFTLKTILVIYINYFQINLLNKFNKKLNQELIFNKLYSEYVEFTKYKSQDYFKSTLKKQIFFVQSAPANFGINFDLPILIIFFSFLFL